METRNNRRLIYLVAFFLISVGILGIAYQYFFPAQPEKPPVPNGDAPVWRLSPEETANIVAQARAAVGHLENDQFARAEQLLVELLARIPLEPIAARNLAVARVLLLGAKASDESPLEQEINAVRKLERFQQAMEALRKVEPEAPSTYWLAGAASVTLAENATDESVRARYSSTAVQDFERAAQRAPDNAVYLFQLYWNGRFNSDEAVLQKARAALHRAFELRPDNLFIVTELLSVQSETKDAGILKTIDQAKKVLAPLTSTIELRARINVLKMLDQAAEGVAAGDWAVVRRSVLPMMGPIRNDEVSQSDRRRVQVHALEFVMHEFSPEFLQKNPLPPPPSSDVPFKFRTADLGEAAASLSDVLDVRVADFDLDDKPDLLVLRTGKLQVYQFAEQAKLGALLAETDVPANLSRLLIADLDQDTTAPAPSGTAPATATPIPALVSGKQPDHCFKADGDVVLYGEGGFLILRNQLADDRRARLFQQVSQDASLDATIPVISATLVDMNHDGHLDIVASTEKGIRLWSNRGQMSFEDLSAFSILPPGDVRFEKLSIVDWDRDVDIDIFLSGTNASQVGYLENLRHGQFRWRPITETFAKLSAPWAIAPLEADGNMSWDVAAVGKTGTQVLLTNTVPASSVKLAKEILVSDKPQEDFAVADFDNNGYSDLLVWGASGPDLYGGRTNGEFRELEGVFGDWHDVIQRCDVVDTDGDGDLDFVVVSNQKISILLNDGGNQNGFLTLHCHGDDDNQSGRVNHWAVGSFVELKAGSAYQAQTITREFTYFGLGPRKQADAVRILWTQGIPQAIIRPAAKQLVCEPMMLKGSCPYLYAWNGQQFEFVTDCLWAAPLGLQLADGVIAPDRPWEYLKVSGERLQPRAGYYELQITEELWEAAYLDQVELLAVDHPDDVEVFSNEKVGPPTIAEFKIHTVRRRHPLVSAHNQHGRDLLPALQRADGKVARAFDKTLRQGLAEGHYLELELGQLEAPRQITLFLTGWIRPTDTSLNVALSHDLELSPPKPPSIWAPDAMGQWREVVSYMGFPGGKMKTIAVDLSHVFSTNDYRLRIVSSAELYWDEAFFTVDDEPVRLDIVPLQLASADLHYRGFSAAIPGPRTLPETYDYQDLDSTPRWPPMRGRFTRFGDVGELVRQSDARLVVMGSGDEITLRFVVPENDPPRGWKRDFILHNVGWDKDADLNTVFGQTVEPLPFVGMKSYPYDEQDFPDSDRYRRYLRDYQTREQVRHVFWQLLAPR